MADNSISEESGYHLLKNISKDAFVPIIEDLILFAHLSQLIKFYILYTQVKPVL